jgi:hypothetical protein
MNCSNNAADGIKYSPYQCFQKGIQRGRRTPFPWKVPSTRTFIPVRTNPIWCGSTDNYDINNPQYERIGAPHECLQKGIGVGRSIRMRWYDLFTWVHRLLLSACISVVIISTITIAHNYVLATTDSDKRMYEATMLLVLSSVLSMYILCYIALDIYIIEFGSWLFP